jgi:hypothetical protein
MIKRVKLKQLFARPLWTTINFMLDRALKDNIHSNTQH